jgi:hypothetical protein
VIGLYVDIDIHLKQCPSASPLTFCRVHAIDFSKRFWIYPQSKLSTNFRHCGGSRSNSSGRSPRLKFRITAYLRDYPSLLTAPVGCTLCIDAFLVGPTAWVTDLAHDSSSYKNCVLFQLTPLDRRFRIVPLRLHPAPSGVASVARRQRVDQVIEEVIRIDYRILLNFKVSMMMKDTTNILNVNLIRLSVSSRRGSSKLNFAISFSLSDFFGSVAGFIS